MRKVFFILLLVFIASVANNVYAQSSKQKELEQKRQEILEEIKNIKSFLFKTQGQKKTVLNEVKDLDQQITARENLIRVTNQQANLLTREINENLNQITSLRDELKQLKEDYGAMIKKSYKSKSQQSRIMFLLSSTDFLQAYKRLQYMKQYAKHRKLQGEKIKEKTVLLQDLNKNLLTQKSQKEALIAANRKAKRTLDKEKKSQEELIASLKKDEGKYAGEIRQKQRETARIDKQIDKLIKEAIAAANAKSGIKSTKTSTNKAATFALTPEAKALAKNFTTNKGKLPWPVKKGVVVGKYGKNPDPLLPNITRELSGVEIATSNGADAIAIFKGTVMEIQNLKGTKAVYIRHGNYITVYSNLISVDVAKGQEITTKQKLGTVYTNPLSKKTVLKFLIYKDSNKMNPADWLYRM